MHVIAKLIPSSNKNGLDQNLRGFCEWTHCEVTSDATARAFIARTK